MRNCLLAAALLAGSAASAPAVRAAEGGGDALLPQHLVLYGNLLAARINPLGLEDRFDLSYRYRLYDDPGLLFRTAYVGATFAPTVNPAVARIGGRVEVQPIAALYLAAGYYFVGWFGWLEYVQSYSSPRADHSDSAQDAGDDRGDAYGTVGSQLVLTAKLQVKVGPIALVNELRAFRNHMALEDRGTPGVSGTSVYYDPRIDIVVPNAGWAVENDTTLAWVTEGGLVLGLRHTLTHAFYPDDAYLPGQSRDNPNGPMLRVGPLVAWVFYDDPEATLNKPTAILIVNWWLKHRYRTGEPVSQALPYIGIAFRFGGDLWAR